jgi:hypothetical protein
MKQPREGDSATDVADVFASEIAVDGDKIYFLNKDGTVMQIAPE